MRSFSTALIENLEIRYKLNEYYDVYKSTKNKDKKVISHRPLFQFSEIIFSHVGQIVYYTVLGWKLY